MEQRIRDFEPLWNAINLIALIGPPHPLVRQTNEHHLLPDAALAQWWVAGLEERAAIMAEYLPLPEFDPVQEVYRGANPLDYHDPDADDIYDLEYAAY